MSDENLPNENENLPQEEAKSQENSALEPTKEAEESSPVNIEEAVDPDITPESASEPAPKEEENDKDSAQKAPDEVAAKISEENNTSSEETEDSEQEEIASSDDEEKDETEPEEDVDYHSLSKAELITEFRKLIATKAAQDIKAEVEEIKTEFNSKFNEELEHKKEEFLAQGGNIIDFHYTTPLKKDFNTLYFDYKEKRNSYYQNLKRDLQANYTRREELIEELKGLLNAEENINTTYKHFKDIQEKWHEAGAIPRDKYNTIWNTYRHHVENFYDFLHLNREFRDLDFKHNLEQKLKLIGRAEELAQQNDIGKAFRELQMLHKMWKEEVGPVAKEHRDEVWDKFSAATKVIHDKRQDFLKDQEKYYEKNLETKQAIIVKIGEIAAQGNKSHKAWQNSIKEVQKLRDVYFEAGKVPKNKSKEIWNTFKEATKIFNQQKNGFYKSQKKEQYTNLEMKIELIKIAEANKDSDEFEVVTPLMKKIQNDWKSVGHVPHKESDKIWKQFKGACNHYFDRVNAGKNEVNKEEMVHFETKQALLDGLSKLELTGDHKADLEVIKSKISEWKDVGRVPFNKRNIDRKFNQVLDGLFGKLNLGKQETEMIRFENKLSSMVSQEDDRKLQNEEFFIGKKISEVKAEINQLENNLGFFQHVPDDNPMVRDVHKNIERHKENLETWKAKLTKIRALRK